MEEGPAAQPIVAPELGQSLRLGRYQALLLILGSNLVCIRHPTRLPNQAFHRSSGSDCRLKSPCILFKSQLLLSFILLILLLHLLSVHILQILQPLLVDQTLLGLRNHAPQLLHFLHSRADHIMRLPQVVVHLV